MDLMNSSISKKKIAILVNHSTAAKFFGELIQNINKEHSNIQLELYMPLKCSIESMTLIDDEMKKNRNIHIYPFVEELDSLDFYSCNAIDAHKIYNLLNNNFDIIITVHAINNTINDLLTLSKKHVYYLIWGNEMSKIVYEHINKFTYNKIINQHDKFFITTQKQLYDNYIKFPDIQSSKLKFAKLGINDISKYENTYSPLDKNIVIILSRIKFWSQHSIQLIKNIASAFPNTLIHIYGKFNQNIFNLPNIIINNTFDSTDQLYHMIKNHYIAINLSFHSNILQYSSMECACIGLPILYEKNSALDNLINVDNFFVYNKDNIIPKLKILLEDDNLSKYKQLFEYSNHLIYNSHKIENLINDWLSLIL